MCADRLREGFRSIENESARHHRIEPALVKQCLGCSCSFGGAFD
jgi:hypothetical protein